jgi:hypothetical protein
MLISPISVGLLAGHCGYATPANTYLEVIRIAIANLGRGVKLKIALRVGLVVSAAEELNLKQWLLNCGSVL